jgi:hypothetical protein
VEVKNRAVMITMPTALKAAVGREARRQGVNLNDLLVGLLAKHYRLAFQPSNRLGATPKARNVAVVLRMPPELKRAIQLDALGRESNMTDVVLRILASALDVQLRMMPVVRRSPFGGGGRRSVR